MLCNRSYMNVELKYKQRHSKIACGYWYRAVVIASKKTRGCIMRLVGSDVEYLSPMQDRKAAASHIIISDYQCFF